MSQTHDDIRALRLMVDELRAEPLPALPWDAIEQRLLFRLAAQSSTREPRSSDGSSAIARVLGFAAAAAVLALGVGSMAGSGALPSAAAPVRHEIDASAVAQVTMAAPLPTTRVHDLSALHPGDVVTAGDAPVTFGQAGLAEWTLAPGSTLQVRSTGFGHTVVLERGSLHAEVVPRDPSEGLVEAFAVEVAGTRIAVHGTAFSVQVEASRVVVDVEHGVVAVGPAGHVGATTGHLLVGPARASFSLDGGRSARWLERPTERAIAIAREPATHAASKHDSPPSGSVASLGVGLSSSVAPSLPIPPAARASVTMGGDPPYPPAQPVTMGGDPPSPPAQPVTMGGAPPAPPAAAREAAPEPAPLTVDKVRARLALCFKQTSETAPSPVLVSVASTLRIDVNPDGSVRSARFDPPLKPQLVQCAGSAIAGRFATDASHIDIPISFQP